MKLKHRPRIIKGTWKRLVKSKMQVFREVELKGGAVSFRPRYQGKEKDEDTKLPA